MMKKYVALYLLLFLCFNKNITAQTSTKTEETVLITEVTSIGKNTFIEADFVQMLTGKAAIKAAKKAGDAEFDINKKGDTTWYVPNDYYVLNENKKLRKLLLSATAEVYLVKEGTSSIAKSSIAKLKISFEGKLFKITLVNNVVTKISEIYTP